MTKMYKRLFLLLSALLLFCFFPQANAEPLTSHSLNVPFMSSQGTNWCGPSVLQMIYAYYGLNITQAEIASHVYNSSTRTTDTGSMINYARSLGFNCTAFTGNLTILEHYIKQGYPLIVLQRYHMSNEGGHYRIVRGFDNILNISMTIDPNFGPKNYTYSEFTYLWRSGSSFSVANWTLLIQPNSTLPDTTPIPPTDSGQGGSGEDKSLIYVICGATIVGLSVILIRKYKEPLTGFAKRKIHTF